MADKTFNPSGDRFTRGIIRRKVDQLARKGIIARHEDSEQDLLIEVLVGMRSYDPTRGHRNKYITGIVEKKTATIANKRSAQKRQSGPICSLSATVTPTDGEPTELTQAISQTELDARLKRYQRTAEEQADLEMDLADVIATLHKPWQELWELRKSLTMVEVSREMGVPRTTLNYWMRHILRRFESAGLQDYL